jgi:hypothetical protein
MGPRPTDGELAALLEWVAYGEDPPHLRSIKRGCEKFKLHRPSVATAFAEPQWRDRYAHARVERADEIAEETHEVANETKAGLVDPTAARVAIDVFKWSAGQMSPKWSPKSAVDVTTAGQPIITTFRVGRERVERIAGGRVDEPDGEPADGG